MLKVHNFLKVILIILCFITIVLSECVLDIGDDPLLKPQLQKRIGSHQIKISNNNRYIELQNNVIITAFCDINFEKPTSYSGLREIVIKCENNNLNINGNSYNYHYHYGSSTVLECTSLKWNLYELSEQFVWCPSDMASYVLARPMNGLSPYNNLAGICYDIENMSPALLYYAIAPRYMKYLIPEALETYYFTPREEIKYVKETFGTKSITSDIYDYPQFKDWIQFANYQYNSTIQNSILKKEVFNEFGSLLDIVWWPNLLLGNWKQYEDALAKHVDNQNKPYDVLAGVADVVMAPFKESCQNNYTMKELIDNTNRKIPLYVWHYLQPKSAHNSSDEVVVIGFNSPFYEFYSEKDVIFCKDICNEIDWLKNVRTSFRYSTMGVMFCCSVEEVKSSKRLSGFPEKLYESTPKTTSALPPRLLQLPVVYDDRSIEVEENVSAIENYE